MSALPTVKVSNGQGGFYILNESDFDPESQELYGDEQEKSRPERQDNVGKVLSELDTPLQVKESESDSIFESGPRQDRDLSGITESNEAG